MHILMIGKYPPIEGAVSAETYWTAQMLSRYGHRVKVITTAHEVEDNMRMALSPEDEKSLHGFFKPNAVPVYSTYQDSAHFYYPAGNPVTSKLIGTALNVCEETGIPDLIWGQYLEPYGVVAMIVAQLLNVPYTIKHAGTDIGNLLPTKQLNKLYGEVFRRAAHVFIAEMHLERFLGMGVAREKLIVWPPVKLRPELFYPTAPDHQGTTFRLGAYGKVGSGKPIIALLNAIRCLNERGSPVHLYARLGGEPNTFQKVKELCSQENLSDYVSLLPFIPHWRIPEFIRSNDAIAYLEQDFRLAYLHFPFPPLEALACGRPLLTTPEVVDKRFYAGIIDLPDRQGKTCFSVDRPVGTEEIVEAISLMIATVKAPDYYESQEWFTIQSFEERIIKRVETVLQFLEREHAKRQVKNAVGRFLHLGRN